MRAKKRKIGGAVAKAVMGAAFLLVAGAGIRAAVDYTTQTRTFAYREPEVVTSVPAQVSSTAVSATAETTMPEEKVTATMKTAPVPMLTVSPAEIGQSDTFAAIVTNVPKGTTPKAVWSDRTYDLMGVEGRWIALLGVDAKKMPGAYSLEVRAGTTTLEKSVEVTKRAFPVSMLAVTPELEQRGYTPSAIQSNIAAENARLNGALIYTPRAYFSKPFVNPLDHISIVGAYGNIRKSGTVELQHLGADLDADEGTSVYAINDGVVNLAENFTNYGKTIVVDHGVGIFSFYLHLSKFDVKAGDKVKRGQVIAKSGNTGYSIAPHLHFSVRIRNASVDPLGFIETANTALTPVP